MKNIAKNIIKLIKNHKVFVIIIVLLMIFTMFFFYDLSYQEKTKQTINFRAKVTAIKFSDSDDYVTVSFDNNKTYNIAFYKKYRVSDLEINKTVNITLEKSESLIFPNPNNTWNLVGIHYPIYP